MNKKYRNKEYLKLHYKKHKESVPKIAEKCSVSLPTIYFYLNKFGLKRHRN